MADFAKSMQRFFGKSVNRNVAVLGITSAISTASIALWQGYLSLDMQSRLSSILVIGGSFSVYGLVTAVSYLVAGPLGDTYGRKSIIVLSTYLLGLSPLLLLFPNNALLIAAPLLLYWAQTALQPNFKAMVMDAVDPAFRGRAFGLFSSMSASVMAIALLASGFALSLTNPSSKGAFSLNALSPFFAISGALILLVACARTVFLKETLGQVTESREKFRASVAKNLEPVRKKALRVPTAAYMLHDSALSLVLFLAPIYAVEETSMTPWMVGAMLALPLVLLVVFQVPFGRFADLRGNAWVISLSFFWEAVFATAFILYKNPVYAALMYVAWMGLGQMDIPAQVALLADLSSIEERATIMGGFGGLTTLVAIPAPLVGGFLYSLYQPSPFFLCSLLLGVSTAMMLYYRLTAG